MRKKIQEKEEAIRLRLTERLSIDAIHKRTGVSIGSLSAWLAPYPLTKAEIVERASTARRQMVEAEKKATIILDWEPQTIKKSDKYDTKGTGDKSTAYILATFLDIGKRVSIPFGDRDRYDLVVDEQGDFIRVQCKTALFKQNHFLFNTGSVSYAGETKNYRGQCDIFAVFLRENKSIYIFNVNNCPVKACSARIIPARCGKLKTRMAQDHILKPGLSLRDYP